MCDHWLPLHYVIKLQFLQLIFAVFHTNNIKYANGVVNMSLFWTQCALIRQLPRSWLKHVVVVVELVVEMNII